jgi:hypothetical protein
VYTNDWRARFRDVCRAVVYVVAARTGGIRRSRVPDRAVRAGEQAPPHTVDATLKAYRDEGRRAVGLVEQALRGERFIRPL